MELSFSLRISSIHKTNLGVFIIVWILEDLSALEPCICSVFISPVHTCPRHSAMLRWNETHARQGRVFVPDAVLRVFEIVMSSDLNHIQGSMVRERRKGLTFAGTAQDPERTRKNERGET
jgi:hypothetical protein